MSVREQKDKLGKTHWVCDRRWPDGTRFRRIMPSREEAQLTDDEIRIAVRRNTWPEMKRELQRLVPKQVLIREFTDYYFEEYCKAHNRCIRRKKTSLDVIKKYFGKTPLSELGPTEIYAFFRWRKKKNTQITNATLNRDLSALKHMITWACDPEIGILRENRIARVKRLEETPEERPRPSDEQIDALLEYMDERIRPIIGFIRETGCRLEEGLSLKHTQVMKKERIVVFSANTKSGKPRFVPLTDEAVYWVEEIPELPGCPYVFWSPKSRTRWYSIYKLFNKARQDAKVDWIVTRDPRRHYGITLAENRAEMHVIQAMLGHSSVKVTEKHYAHFSPHYAARRAFEVLQGRKKGRTVGRMNENAKIA